MSGGQRSAVQQRWGALFDVAIGMQPYQPVGV
jgi:hypothetical protein